MQTFIYLTEEVNEHLSEKFSNNFIKAVILGFPLNLKNPTGQRRKRVDEYGCSDNGYCSGSRADCSMKSSIFQTTQEISPTMPINSPDTTTGTASTVVTDPSYTAHSSASISTTTSSTV
ncbi:unnamed protein product [Adineta steineri]|uniref:Uncharacterized protein n=1 Tax=Adineta steineri TaxID=433720 RepID=A0A815H2M9_9BILA|nr:unnamed protein product [Adineta steineri]CAF1595215.1 unnamed protein product [Adineta steineri]